MFAFTGGHTETVAGRAQLELVDADSLFALYRPRVLRLCRRILRSNEAAEDACQEALARAYEALPHFRSDAPMWPWLATITANVCRDLLRRDRPTEPIEAADGEVMAWSDPEQLAAGRSRVRLVCDAIASLPPAYRTPVYLREIEGWSYARIAEVRGRTVASVRTTLMRGRRLLANRIEDLARERHEWPLPAAALGGAWMRRLRVRVARLQAAFEGTGGQWWRVDNLLATLASVPMSIIAPAVATAAAIVAFSVTPANDPGAPEASLQPEVQVAVDATHPLPAVSGDQPTAGSEAPAAEPRSPAPAIQVGSAETRTDGEARVATPAVEVAPAPPTPETAADGASDGTAHIGPVGIYCGSEERRQEGMTLLCNALGG